ncbi:MAG: aldolase [Nocardioidaceae bacterium]|nr:aldolase [Nocardioidaceae bacterium]
MASSDVPAPRLTPVDVQAIDDLVAPADERMERLYPGDDGRRQPIHTVYVPAHEVTADLAHRWGDAAKASLDAHAPSPMEMAKALEVPAAEVVAVWPLLLAKLEREPIEDLRIDLEDGYGDRGDATEDADAVAAARALGTAHALGLAPPYCGIRFKSLEAATRRRGLRTLDLVLGALLAQGPLPYGWTVTLPKVTSVEQVEAMVEACARLEAAYGLADHRLTFEVQVEAPQAVLGSDGVATVSRLIHASDDRCTALHFGTYDYTAALGIPAGHQAMDHPAADHAKAVMALAAAGTGVWLSDGSSNVLPVGERSDVHQAWATHARLVRRSLERGIYQGWDLHPAQLPSRYLATYLFLRAGLDEVGARLRRYAGGGGGAVLDEPATAQALAAGLVRGVHCGAVTVAEAESVTGSDIDQLKAWAMRRVG